jgi:programmed cell death 8 (apoptosis-inducing factor)
MQVFAPTQIDANTDLAEDAGLEIDRENSGIIVNGELQAFSDIYVGGDAASFPNRFLGRRREQNYDHAGMRGAECSPLAENMSR